MEDVASGRPTHTQMNGPTHGHTWAAVTGLRGLSTTPTRHNTVKHTESNSRKLEKETWVYDHISLDTFSKIKKKFIEK